MASFEKELGRWSLQETGGLAKLLASDYMSRLSPVKSISSIDHLLQFPSKVDSAYSSFSGGSTLPDYHTSPVYNADYCLPPSQLSYMDSEYVSAIYNPSVLNSDLGETYPLKPADINTLNGSENIYNANVGGQSGGSSFLDSACKSPSPLPPPPPPPPLPYPPSAPTRHESYKALQTFDKPKSSSNMGPNIHQRKPKTPPEGSMNSFIYTCDSKGSHLEDSWKARLKTESRDLEYSETKNNSPSFTKLPSFVLQESLQSVSSSKTQTVACVLNAVPEYYSPGHANSKVSHPPRSNHNVNDLPESKHYFYLANFHKQTFSSSERSGINSDSKEQEGKLSMHPHHSVSEEPSKRDENVPQGITSVQYARHALQKEPMTADRVGGWENIDHHHTKRLGNHVNYSRSEEEKHKDIRELGKNTTFRPCDPSQIGNSDIMEASFSHRGEMESSGKLLSSRSNPIFYCGPKAEPSLRSSSAFKSEKQTNDCSPKNVADAESNKTQLDSHMSKSHPLCDLTSEKITKEKTPMLFHLASGRHAQLAAMFNLKKQASQEEAVKVPKRTSQSTYVSTTEGRDTKRENKPPLTAKARPQFTDDNFSIHHGDEPMPGSPGTSADDSCMDDYREKLKTAQKKVLRETSFKRRDLQMSLPIRLKVNPSKRPTIEHFKSLSLTHDHENVESTPLDGTLANDDNSKNEEPKKPLVSRIGGRKRKTKEDRKLYHSEPEKLDQLGVVQDPRSLRKGDSTGMVSSEATEVSSVTSRKMAFENRERARSASNLLKTELKQIQHSALLQYIERKTGQRSTSTQHIPSYKPPPTGSSGRRHSEWISYSSTQTITPPEGSSKPPALQKSPESSCQHSSTYGTERLSGSFLGTEATASKSQVLVREADSSHTNSSSSMEHHRHAEEPFPTESRERLKSAPPFQITPRSGAYAQFSLNCEANINTAGSPVALNEGIDRIIPGRESVSSSRGRGKSMEEIGTSEIVHLAVLSQSSDQLFQAQGLDTSPVRSPQWSEPALADNLQLHLGPSPEKESETLSRQTQLEEDILGLYGGNSRTSAFQRYSRTVQSKEEFPGTNGSPSFSLPVTSRSQYSEERPGSPDQILPSRSPVEEDEVFLQDSPSSTKADLKSSRLHANAVGLSPRREEPSLLSANRLSCLVPSEEEEQTATEHTYSTRLPQDDASRDVATEVSLKMRTDDCANVDYVESKTNALLSEDASGVNSEERLVTDVDNSSVSNLQPPAGTADYTYSQGNKICCDSISSVQSESNGNGTNCELPQDVSETVAQDLTAVERTTDLLPVKLKSPEDQRCELLVQEIIAKDQSLVDILDPGPFRKTAVDLMEGLFPVDMTLLDRSNRKKAINRESAEETTEISRRPIHPPTKYQVQHPNGEPQKDVDDLTSKKVELAANIQAKLQHLQNERELLLSDVEQNCSHGTELELVLKQVCKPNEYDRYMMFIGDLEKVVSLLLCLSMRLARVENARSKVNEGTDAEERHSLNERHNLLSRQREDAKDLKENLDRREKVVLGILSKYLSEQQLRDYQLFVKLKTSLLVEQKDLDEKMRFHEEQLERLQDSIPT